MIYPSKLLPSVFFRLINPNNIRHLNVYLIRHTPNKTNFQAGQIIESSICEQSSHIEDLSLNFYGKYDELDISIDIKQAHKEHFFSVWTPFQRSRRPNEDQFEQDHNRGWYYLPLSKLHLFRVPIENPLYSDFTVTCEVVHKPVRCNFWHVQLRWKDEKGVILSKKAKTWKRTVQTSSKSFIKIHAVDNANGSQSIPLCIIAYSHWNSFKG